MRLNENAYLQKGKSGFIFLASKGDAMNGMYTHDTHLQTIAQDYLKDVHQQREIEHVLRQARISWRKQLARTLIAWASKLEPETRNMTTRAI